MMDWAEQWCSALCSPLQGSQRYACVRGKYVGMMMSYRPGFGTIGMSGELAIASDTYLILDRSF